MAEHTSPIKIDTVSTFKHIRNCFMVIVKELGLGSYQNDPIEYVPKYVSELGLDSSVEQLIIQFLQYKVPPFVMNGKDPRGYAVAAIYLVCKINNQKIT